MGDEGRWGVGVGAVALGGIAHKWYGCECTGSSMV